MRDNPAPLVSIILVNYNGAEVIVECLQSLQQYFRSIPYETIMVDNASTDGSPDIIEANFPQVRLVKQTQNTGFGAGNNAGAKLAKGEFLFLLNTDTLLVDDILPHLIDVMKDHPQVGIVGPKLLNSDNSLQLSTAHEISIFGEYKTQQQYKKIEDLHHQVELLREVGLSQEVDVVVGAAFLIRKKLFDELGGFDENFFMYFEESDLCKRARDRGWKIVYTTEVSLFHLRGYSVNKAFNSMAVEYRRSQLYYYQKHRPVWEQFALRIYLLLKFSIANILFRNKINLTILSLVLNFKRFPIKLSRSNSVRPSDRVLIH